MTTPPGPALLGRALFLALAVWAAPAAAQDPQTVLLQMNAVLQEQPDAWEAHALRGMALADLGRCEEAVDALARVVEAAPWVLEARYIRAECHTKLGRHGDAVKDLEVAHRATGGDPAVTRVLAWALVEARRYAEALVLYERLLAQGQDLPDLLSARGETRYRAGDVAGALADFDLVVARAPREAQPYRIRADLYLRAGKAAEAIRDYDRAAGYQKATDLPELRGLTFINRGYLRHLGGDSAGALRDIEQGIEIDPDNPFGYRNRALLRLEAGDPAAACADLREAGRRDFHTKWGTFTYGPDIRVLNAKHCS